MNSRIYCLPQKHGWNALKTDPKDFLHTKVREIPKAKRSPYFTMKFNNPPPSQAIENIARPQYPALAEFCDEGERQDLTLKTIYTTEFNRAYGQPILKPKRTLPPITYETRADPLLPTQKYNPPMEKLTYPNDDLDRYRDASLYQWRQMRTQPDMLAWQPLEKIPVLGNVGNRTTLPPFKIYNHDPEHERERWDNAKNLARKNAVAYGYRQEVPGYAGHRQHEQSIVTLVEKDVAHPNHAMESTAQACYREYPVDHYNPNVELETNKHKGPLSRMVTLTHPFNPFTQQSAYSNSGASSIQ